MININTFLTYQCTKYIDRFFYYIGKSMANNIATFDKM